MTGTRIRLIALALLSAVVALPAQAPAQVPNRDIVAQSGPVEIARHQGRLLRLSKSAASVFIANPAIADITVKSSRMVYIFGKAPGRTTLFAVDSNENVIADLDIQVTHDLSGLRNAIDTLLPANGITLDSVEGGLVLGGPVASATDAENIRRLATRFVGENEEVINRLAVTDPNQVNVRVRIAEVSRSVVKQLGLNFDILSGDFRFTSGSTFLDNPSALAGIGNFTLSQNAFGAGILSGATLGGATVNALFDAMEEIGLVKTLAEPNLTALSGETASFLAGGEFPIPTIDSDGQVSVEFKQFGVSLSFTPTMISGRRISMRVRPEVSALSDAGAVSVNGLAIPALTTRRAETTIELGSGQSFAIAGLLQDDFQDNVRQMPYVADIPLFGELFKSESFRRKETELIILVTPYVVQPMNDRSLPLPTEPLTKSPVALATDRKTQPSASLSRSVQVPIGIPGAEQTGAATYMLD